MLEPAPEATVRLVPLAMLLATPSLARPPAGPPALEEVAADLVGRALLSTEAWDELVVLCDDVGPRLASSPAMERAVAWAVAELEEDGLVGVRAEEVQVPEWERGEQRLQVLAPVERELQVLTLGRSVGTPPGGITAEVVVVDDFDHLEALGDVVAGRIVLYDEPFTSYGQAASYRNRGARRAAALGAVGVLVRSPTPQSLASPHTGGTWYEEDGPRIPAAAVTLEDAGLLRRWAERGLGPRVRLELGARSAGEATSANVLGEVPGRSRPDEIVVLGCHLDSWDVGQGAQDDGAGCVMVMAAAGLIAELPVAPRRTLRVVLFTDEESGQSGARAYQEAHREERHIAALECDLGAGEALGFRVDVRTPEERREADLARAQEVLAPVVALLGRLDAGYLEPGWAGTDVKPLVEAGALGLGLHQDTSGYWPVHHSEADTIDKIDPNVLARDVAVVAVMAWALAELPELSEWHSGPAAGSGIATPVP